MLRTIGRSVWSGRGHFTSASRSGRVFSTAVETDQWMVWPRETEGNTYSVNWSLVGDGVTPTGEAYRNARVGLLTSKLSAKPSSGKVELKDPTYFGDFKLQEAGDASLSLEAFEEMSESLKLELSREKELFVEDAALGTFGCVRIGVRVVSSTPAMAMISRALLVPVPPRECDHRARFDGWNLDPLWQSGETEKVWDGEKYIINNSPAPAKGIRPIVALVGGASTTTAVEFVQKGEQIVGANVVVGTQAPVRGLIEAIGHAATVLINEQQSASLALPSTSFTKGSNTCVVIGADDSITNALVSDKTIYGAYHNVVTETGLSACWNGSLGVAAASSTSVPSVVVGGKSANALIPDNLAGVPTHYAFYEKGAKKGSLAEADAVKKIVEIVGESKAELAATLLKGAKCSIVGSAADLSSLA